MEALLHKLASNNAYYSLLFPIALNKATTPTNCVLAGANRGLLNPPDCSLLLTSYYTPGRLSILHIFSSLSIDASYQSINQSSLLVLGLGSQRCLCTAPY